MVWGYGKEADKLGVEIHPYTEVTGINVDNGKVTGVETNRGTIARGTVISCVAGWSTLICDMVGVPLPLTTHILQACVTEPVKPLLDKIIVSGTLHIYISQSDRGEFVMGSEIEPYSGYSTKGTFRFIEDLAMHMIELLPMLGEAKILRQWTGLCDVSPDYSPIMGDDRGGRLRGRRRLGHLRLQGLADRRPHHRRAGRHRQDPRPDRSVPAGALLRGRARVRARRRRRFSH